MKKHIFIVGVFIFIVITMFFVATKKPEIEGNLLVVKTTSAVVRDTPSSSQKDSIPSVITSLSSAGEVTFPHQQHFTDFGLECKACHHEINAAKLKFPHENYFDDFWIDCKICHHESGSVKLQAQACSKCHHTYPSVITDETLSSKVVIHKQCWGCHKVGKGEEASKSCKKCHTGSRVKF